MKTTPVLIFLSLVEIAETVKACNDHELLSIIRNLQICVNYLNNFQILFTDELVKK